MGLSTSIYPVQKILFTDVLRVVDNIITLPINTENITEGLEEEVVLLCAY